MLKAAICHHPKYRPGSIRKSTEINSSSALKYLATYLTHFTVHKLGLVTATRWEQSYKPSMPSESSFIVLFSNRVISMKELCSYNQHSFPLKNSYISTVHVCNMLDFSGSTIRKPDSLRHGPCAVTYTLVF